MRWSLVLAGFNILVTWAMSASLMTNKNPRFLPVSDFNSDKEFLLVGVLPSLLCYLAGCAFLLLHYKAFHPWRNLFTWQRKQDARAVLKEETPFWEEDDEFLQERDALEMEVIEPEATVELENQDEQVV